MACRGKILTDFPTRIPCRIIGGPDGWANDIYNKQGVTVPGRKLAVIRAFIDIDKTMDGQMFEVKPNFLLTNEHPNLVIVPMLHQVRGEK